MKILQMKMKIFWKNNKLKMMQQEKQQGRLLSCLKKIYLDTQVKLQDLWVVTQVKQHKVLYLILVRCKLLSVQDLR